MHGLTYDLGADWAPDPNKIQKTHLHHKRGGVYEAMEDGTRIDTILGNEPAASSVSSYAYDWSAAFGMDHVMLRILVNADRMDDHCWVPVHPMSHKVPDFSLLSDSERKDLHARAGTIFRDTWPQ